jgi:hypothetical protein
MFDNIDSPDDAGAKASRLCKNNAHIFSLSVPISDYRQGPGDCSATWAAVSWMAGAGATLYHVGMLMRHRPWQTYRHVKGLMRIDAGEIFLLGL